MHGVGGGVEGGDGFLQDVEVERWSEQPSLPGPLLSVA